MLTPSSQWNLLQVAQPSVANEAQICLVRSAQVAGLPAKFDLYQQSEALATYCNSRERACEKISEPGKLRRSAPLPMGEARPLAVRVRGNVLRNMVYYPSSCPSPIGRRNAVAPLPP